MKIIKKGSLGKKYRHTCDKCDTIFEFYKYEAKCKFPENNNNYVMYMVIECPVCKKECHIFIYTD